MRQLLVLALALLSSCLPAADLTDIRQKLSAGTEPVTIVCLGDSVTGVYYHTGGRRAYPEMLELALQRQFPRGRINVVNAGISGQATVNGLARLDSDVLRHRPHVVTVMFGLNDMVRVPLAEYRAHLATIVQRCREAGAVVVLCTPNSVIDTAGRPVEKLITYCHALREMAAELQTPLADVYAAFEGLHGEDARGWRLLFSDEIHPNMDGHKRMAEELAHVLAGTEIRPLDVPPPRPALPRTRALLSGKKPVRILAMTPTDSSVTTALRSLFPDEPFEVKTWDTVGKTLEALEQEAKATVRMQRPDLVVISIPRSADAPSEEARIHAISWILNWSLSFGQQEWDCLVIHPQVGEPLTEKAAHDDLLRQLVRAQDLTLLDRDPADPSKPIDLVTSWFRAELAPNGVK